MSFINKRHVLIVLHQNLTAIWCRIAGVWLPRAAEDGSSLPSARLVSISVIPDIDSPDEKHSLWVMQYGQFVDHDLTSTPVFRMGTLHSFITDIWKRYHWCIILFFVFFFLLTANAGEGIMCCSEDGSMMKDPTLIHPECLPIRIPDDDPFFAKHGQRCMSFIRSMPAPRSDCNFGFGEQVKPTKLLFKSFFKKTND